MLLSDIYKMSKAWMYEKKSSTIYNDYIIEVANKVLAETFEENNMCRMFKGKLPFIDGVMAHQIKNLQDTVDYEEEYLLDVIPKGISANFLMDDDLTKMSKYDTEYNNARVMNQRVVSSSRMKELYELAQKEVEDAS